MSYFFDPTGRSTYGIGICDRCRRVFSIEDLYPDPNSPGLRVCLADRDDFDPYRLPARQSERINLPFVRPDVPLDGRQPPFQLPWWLITETDNNPLITENGINLVVEDAL
jgi:hypothetical protein